MIGSGPAGLAAAQQLTRAGHTVAVYERADKIGGLLRYGIPEFKMEKKHLDRRLDQMRREGTVFRAGVDVGDDAHRRRSCASGTTPSCSRSGATVARDLPVPGRELGGIHQAMEYLPQSNRASLGEEVEDQITADRQARRDHRRRRHRRRLPRHVDPAGRRVGHPAGDHAAAAARTGPAGQPWPTYPMIFRVSSAHEEAGERVYAVSTQEFLGDDDGNVRALRLVEVEFKDGKFSRGRGHRAGDPGRAGAARDGLHRPRAGRPGRAARRRARRARQHRPRRVVLPRASPGVFVAGDAGRGQSLIVWAIAEGRAAAAAVDTYLTGSTTLPAPIPPTERPLVV